MAAVCHRCECRAESGGRDARPNLLLHRIGPVDFPSVCFEFCCYLSLLLSFSCCFFACS